MHTIKYEYFDSKHPSYVEESVRRSLGQYISRCNYVYVGRTNNPESRFKAHQNNLDPGVKNWDEMVVVYATRSLGFSVQMENALIEFIQRGKFQNVRWNEKGTQWRGPQDFTVYVLTDSTGQRKPKPNNNPLWPAGILTGHYDLALQQLLCQKLDYYTRNKKRCYVGMTNDPWRRFGEHQRDWDIGWDNLIVLYRTSSLDYAARAETKLIQYIKDKRNQSKFLNTGSGMMPADEEPYFYVYFLLDKKYA